MKVICLEEEAFYELVEQVIQRVKDRQHVEDKWISAEEAMAKLRVKSKTTLQHLRDIGAIRFSQPQKKLIVYDSASINAYLEKHAKDTF